MRILVTGAGGMLGREVTLQAQAQGHTVIPTGRREGLIPMDITNPAQVRAVFEEYQPEVVVHCAAMTHVDACEHQPETAFRVNAFGTEVIASHCARIGAACMAVSTDYVFDGAKGSPYHEYDAPNPLSVYGRSKYAGEQAVQAICARHYIVRTAWLYGIYGRSFPHFVLEKVRAGQPATVIADQIGSPTYTADVAERILRLMTTDCYGVYHLTNQRAVSRYEFAQELVRACGFAPDLLVPLKFDEWRTPAPRPRYSAMVSWRLAWAGVPPMPDWRDALRRFLAQIGILNR